MCVYGGVCMGSDPFFVFLSAGGNWGRLRRNQAAEFRNCLRQGLCWEEGVRGNGWPRREPIALSKRKWVGPDEDIEKTLNRVTTLKEPKTGLTP